MTLSCRDFCCRFGIEGRTEGTEDGRRSRRKIREEAARERGKTVSLGIRSFRFGRIKSPVPSRAGASAK